MLFYHFLLAIVCFQCTLASHPKFIACNKRSDEGTIVILKNSTWQECKNGQLVAEHCIAEVNGGHYDCVPHFRVKNRLDTYTSIFTKWIAAKYYTDGNKQFADCVKIQAEKQSSLQQSTYKIDCTKDMEKLSQGGIANELCALKGKKIYSLTDNDWMTCKNGVFQLDKCMTYKNDGKFYCIPVMKIENALKSSGKLGQLNQGSFCYNFFQNPATYYPNYENDLTVCTA